MPIPASYTEKSLAEFMAAELGKVATLLGYAVGAGDAGAYAEAVNESILRYGAATIAEATDILKIRAFARVEAWRKACNDLATFYKVSSDGSTFDRETVYKQAVVNLNRAFMQAIEWDESGAYAVTVTRVTPVNDPYRYRPDTETTL
ncbi:MAG TPA: hypothetical protein VGK00_10320 [Anaerolineales bacterium]|jgi:hypothetical protein